MILGKILRDPRTPNTISLSRVVFFHLVILALSIWSTGWQQVVWFILVIGIYLADSLDGAIARRYGTANDLGKIVDAGCDKPVSSSGIQFVISYVMGMVGRNLGTAELVICIAVVFIWTFRDTGVTIFRHIVGATFPTERIGKFRTILAGALIGVVFGWFAWGWIVGYILAGISFVAISLWLSRGKNVKKSIAFLFFTLTFPPFTAPLGLIAITIYSLVRYSAVFRDEMTHDPARLWRKLAKPLAISTAIASITTFLAFYPLFKGQMITSGGFAGAVYMYLLLLSFRKFREKEVAASDSESTDEKAPTNRPFYQPKTNPKPTPAFAEGSRPTGNKFVT